jgi:hypothetical protein
MRSFQAVVAKQGPNPFVDVPEAVTRAFAPWSRAGRVLVAGRLNQAEVQESLVPAGKGRQRFYLHGGMRSAARVAVGDRVRVALRAFPAEPVVVPRRLRAALRREPAARAAFEALTPAARRQLIRAIEAATTPTLRLRRIEQTVAHLLGAEVEGRSSRPKRELWSCPKCGNRFVTRNMFHSCRRHRLEDAFEGKPPFVRDLFDRLRTLIESFGPVAVVPYRDRVGFMERVRFGAAIPRRAGLDVHFWLRRRFDHPRFRRVETIYPNAHAFLLRVTGPEEIDAELTGWLREAYAVGRHREPTPTDAAGRP